MNASQLDEEAVFQVARRIASPEARAAYLGQVCGDDAALRGRVERLLRVCEQEASFLAAPACAPTVELPAPVERPGSVIGPYKLLEAIGEGGMGTVYMAEQSQPVRRKVALKLIKPGMDTKQVVARFEAERQALALMDHPNIARVLDGGATDSGRPYFVMDLVRGIPITEYCDREQLTVPERLELFVLVCRAVQHAHQKGIIHRDLKPSNILVTVIDGVPVPKVIDFGVAKATGPSLTERTLFTGFHQMLGTPLYMSPEQADLAGVDVDTRSDVYALGVLLYELLTGTTPFDREAFSKAAFEEMRRIIREEEPPKPSTRLSTLGEALTTVSANRKADPRRLNRSVRGELDWVVMKALEKDRRRRYESAGDFAADVMRFLTDQPVEACPPSAWYRFSKYARRHRARLSTAALVGLALVVGTAASTWQAVRATRAGDLAEQQRGLAARREQEARAAAAESEAVLRFLVNDLLGATRPEKALGRDVKVSEVLANAEKKIDAAFRDQPLVEAGVRHALAVAYLALGQTEAAHRHAARARDLRLRHLGAEHPLTLDSTFYLAVELQRLGKYDEAFRLHQQVLAARRRVLGPEHPDTLISTQHLASTLGQQGKPGQEREVQEQLLAVRRRVLGAEHPETLGSMNNLALDLMNRGRYEESRKLHEQVLGARRRVLGPEHPDTLGSMHGLALVYGDLGRLEEARQLHEKTLEIERRVLGPEHPDTLQSIEALACALDDESRSAEARKLFEELIATKRRIVGPEHPDTLTAMANLANVLDRQGKYDEARTLLEETERAARRVLGAEHPFTLYSMDLLAHVLYRQEKFGKARALQAQLVEVQRRVNGPEHPATLMAMDGLAHSLRSLGKYDEARALWEQVLEARRRLFGPDSAQAADAMYNLAVALAEPGKLDNARPLFEQALSVRRRVLGAEHPDTLDAMHNVAVLLARQGKPGEARKLFEQVLEARRRVLGPEHPYTLATLGEVARLSPLDERRKLFEQVLEAQRRVLGSEHRDTLRTMNNVACVLDDSGQKDEARKRKEALLAIQRRVFGPEHPDTLHSMHSLAVTLFSMNRVAEAMVLLQQTLEIQRRILGPEHPDTLNVLDVLATALGNQGRVRECNALFEELAGIQRRLLGPEHSSTRHSMRMLAKGHRILGEFDRAAELLEPLLEAAHRLQPEHPDTMSTRSELASVRRAQGKDAEVERLYVKLLADPRVLAEEYPVRLGAMRGLAELYLDRGSYAEAEPLLTRRVEALRRQPDVADWELALALETRSISLFLNDKYAEAEPVARECLAIYRKTYSNHWARFATEFVLGGILLGTKKDTEAEPLLLSGYEGCRACESKLLPNRKSRLLPVGQRIVELYDASGRAEKAAQWKAKLGLADLPADVFTRPGAAHR